MTKEKLERLKTLFEIINDGLTRDEFTMAFEKVVKQVLKLELKLIEEIKAKTKEEKEALRKLKEEFEEIISSSIKESDSTFGGFRRRSIEAINKLFERNEVNKKLKEKLRLADQKILELTNKIASIKNGKDGKDGLQGEPGLPGKDGEDGKDGKDAEEVDEEKIIEEILKRMPKGKGGGTSAIGIANAAKYWVKTEEPVGDIDGANTSYTVSKPIFAVLSFMINGEVIAQLPNYTVSGKTVTFSTAIPAAYSGKDFEIVYV